MCKETIHIPSSPPKVPPSSCQATGWRSPPDLSSLSAEGANWIPLVNGDKSHPQFLSGNVWKQLLGVNSNPHSVCSPLTTLPQTFHLHFISGVLRVIWSSYKVWKSCGALEMVIHRNVAMEVEKHLFLGLFGQYLYVQTLAAKTEELWLKVSTTP